MNHGCPSQADDQGIHGNDHSPAARGVPLARDAGGAAVARLWRGCGPVATAAGESRGSGESNGPDEGQGVREGRGPGRRRGESNGRECLKGS